KFAHAWYGRGIAYCELDKPGKAAVDFSQAVALLPQYGPAQQAMAMLLATCPDLERADARKVVEALEKAIKLAPRDSACWAALGMARYRAGEWKASVEALDRSAELRRGGEAMGRLFLAMAQRRLGSRDQARKSYDQALRWLKTNQEALAKNKPLA